MKKTNVVSTPAMKKQKKAVYCLRWALFFFCILALFYLYMSYDLVRLEEGNDSLSSFAEPGDMVMTKGFGAVYQSGNKVFYHLELDGQLYLSTGVIYAMAGDTLRIQERSILLTDDNNTTHSVTIKELITPLGVIPLTGKQEAIMLKYDGKTLGEDEFLVCSLNLESEQPDGRSIGLCSRSQLKSRILMKLDF